ncbi:FAD binding domain-containing protein [Pseudoduganella albidiflava]|uniref:FAD-binding molybdopterin dehydrogenase n=1 Tax=Pseudoduganella albidiflava TaxID=321983 RepID=A0A411WTV1_9BURK|nr:xanthine dehydrogenase family protein subunit M [Pseudoduganella albidiflava]QBH99916.1 xanthine dehydrogenase family protein subunit M [Pseudoduganella albidiflava]GGY54843.1 FAD-binding molybdopterin dehydrogenase [Pseudoduganella albidiflava]
MNPFAYDRPATVEAALQAIAAHAAHAASGTTNTGAANQHESRFVAGGTNLLDLMKEGVTIAPHLVDINRLPLDAIEESPDGGLLLGALARNADTAYHPLVEQRYPLLSAAILAGASPQLRNMASNGGNLLQRTRCWYFYDVATPCNKRTPGSGCSANGGITRQHAILGASEHCIATHPSDMCVALAALEAVVHVQSVRGKREIPFAEFHRLPGDRPDIDTTLAPDELITGIALPDAARFVRHSAYLKLRERLSYAFALVSVAAALDIGEDGTIAEARIALGGVAHKPWRLPEAEQLLAGAAPGEEAFGRVADALLHGAVGRGANDFKIPLARNAIVRALHVASQGTVTNQGMRKGEDR